MDLCIPHSFVKNLDTIIKFQNIQLINEICRWKNWDPEELINELILDNKKQKKIIKSKVDFDSPSNSTERVILNKVEIRVRTMWIFEGIEYYYESPNDNVYNLDGTYVGKKKNGKINKYYVED